MKHCGKRFNCGQCIPSIEERLRVVIGDAANDHTSVPVDTTTPLLDAAE
jgi:NAD(P)H-nitrite reductase large subunit